MFWKKKRNPGDSAAQHLANLLGTNLAGFTPKTIDGETPKLDLNAELFVSNNVAIAELVIIAGLLKNDDDQRREILRFIEPEFMGEKSFEGYLFSLVRESLEDKAKVSLSKIGEKIPEYGPKVYGEALGRQSLEGYYFKWSQALSLEPTQAEVQKAIEIIRTVAEKKGWLSEECI